MKFKNGFSFAYGDRKITGNDLLPAGEGVKSALFGNLKVTRKNEKYAGGVYTVNTFENTGDGETALLSEIADTDGVIAFPEGFHAPGRGFLQQPKVILKSYRGSNCDEIEYSAIEHELHFGEELVFAPVGGRSCETTAPYFELSVGESGVIFGVGWTGRWKASFRMTEAGVSFRAGLDGAEFYLKPGEKVRTVSLLAVEYEKGSDAGHNAFRRAMRERCVLGKGDRPPYGRVNAMTWGAMKSATMLEHIKGITENDLGFECFFIDAGWYGHSTQYSKNEHEGDWGQHTGSWNVNTRDHPDGLKEVSEAAHQAGLEMLLWVEPERARRGTDWVKEHPEVMIDIGRDDLLVDLGDPKANKMVFEMLSGHIETLKLDCYRQDFNFDPLPYWQSRDTEGRRGITEILYINGLYKLWDALLERFPKLYIDNCSSGGRRNDIEMLARALPLWRSDYQCFFNADPDVTQAQNTAVSSLFPYSATGINGAMDDVYEIRSCYGSALSEHNWWWTEENPVVKTPAMDILRALVKEYKKARPYFNRDFYPLTAWSLSKKEWCVWQYHDPEKDEGVLMTFRREKSPVAKASFLLSGLTEGDYAFEDSLTGESFVLSDKEIGKDGVTVSLPEKRSSKVIFYHKK